MNLCLFWQAWEYGLPLCEELASVYKNKILYENLGRILVSIGNTSGGNTGSNYH